MLIEMAIGDAYGAGFEYVPDRVVAESNNLSGYVQHPRHAVIPGCYTDDTQMSLAIAEAIVAGDPWTPAALAKRFLQVFQRDPRHGYARGYHQFIQTVTDGRDFLSRIKPYSDKSGAAMRAPPIGVFSSITQVIDYASVQARITHDTPEGVRAACLAALMTHYFLYRLGPRVDLLVFLNDALPGSGLRPWAGKVRQKGMMSVAAAATAVSEHDSLSAMLQGCVAFTGDVDTVAAIALAAGACSHEVRQDLPERLYATLENGVYGRGHLQLLNTRLLAIVAQQQRTQDG